MGKYYVKCMRSNVNCQMYGVNRYILSNTLVIEADLKIITISS